MTTIDKIRAEIERLMSGYKPIVGGVDELTGANIVLAKLLSFLDTLEEPVSDCHDLEEAAEEYNKQVTEETKCHHNALTYAEGYEDALLLIPDAFKAGAEWQKKQDEENYAWVKQLPNPNIEKLDGIEITTSDSSAGGKELLYVSNKSYNIGLRDGMAEQKRKMMEGAVEGVVYRYESYQRIATAIIVDINRELLGNKVKIIIVKEDGQ